MSKSVPTLIEYAKRATSECTDFLAWLVCMESGNLLTNSEIENGTRVVDDVTNKLLNACIEYEKQVDILMSL